MAEEHKKNIFGSSAKMSVMTMISRVFGLVRDQTQAGFLGTGAMSDAFSAAFLIPNLLRRLFAEGAMTASFVPVFTEVEKKCAPEEAKRFFSSFFTLLFGALIIVVAIGMLAAPFIVDILFKQGTISPEMRALTVRLMRVMFPYIFFISLASVLQGVLNVHKNFSVPAFTPVLLNLSIIGVVTLYALVIAPRIPSFTLSFSVAGVPVIAHTIIDTSFYVTYAFAIGALLGGALQFLFQLPFVMRIGYRIRPAFNFKNPYILRIGKIFVPGIFGAGIYQINALLSNIFAQRLGPGRLSALAFSSRLNEFTLGVFAVSIATVMLSALSKHAAEDNRNAFMQSLSYSLRLLALVTIPATVGIWILSGDIVSLLLQFGQFSNDSVRLVSTALKYMSTALFFIASYRTLTQSFYSLKDTRTPVFASACSMLMNALLCVTLPRLFPEAINIAGIGLANALSNAFLFLLLYVLLKRKLHTKELFNGFKGIVQTIIAAAAMGVPVWLGAHFLFPNPGKALLLAKILIVIALSAGVYFLLLFIMKNEDFRDIIDIIKKRFIRPRKEQRPGTDG